MSHDVGHVLEIKKNLEDKLVHELFSQKNDFNIWLSNRDLTNELTLLSSFPLFDVVVAPWDFTFELSYASGADFFIFIIQLHLFGGEREMHTWLRRQSKREREEEEEEVGE